MGITWRMTRNTSIAINTMLSASTVVMAMPRPAVWAANDSTA